MVERTESNYFEVAETIKEAIIRYSECNAQEMLEIRKEAYGLSKKADWGHFIRYYLEAYDGALRRCGGYLLGRG